METVQNELSEEDKMILAITKGLNLCRGHRDSIRLGVQTLLEAYGESNKIPEKDIAVLRRSAENDHLAHSLGAPFET